ncbi:MAG: magnesium-translocating P-type ATPase [Deltaproteobacteria bacterium]|nr:magnesium-translocating P-type ATPase [Deltaproteobacteria bacterium]
MSHGELFSLLKSSPSGLTDDEAAERLKEHGPNLLKKKERLSKAALFLNQFKNPIVLILLFAVVVSAVVKDFIESAIIFVILLASGFLGFIQEYSAANSVEALLKAVKTRVTAIRGGARKDVLMEEAVPGDIVLLSAGSRVPADAVLLEAKDFFVNEAILTGETFPVEKAPFNGGGQEKRGAVFMGSSVTSGTARALVVNTGAKTQAGMIARRLVSRPPETDFERGIRHFGYFLMEVTLVLVLIVFAVNVYFRLPVIDSLMFSLALAVGLTPQLLPAIVSVNLSKGSLDMSKKDVIVKRLASIENFGTMDILCTDKTGTLTEGKVFLDDYLDHRGRRNDKTLFYAYLNAAMQTGLANPIDEAVTARRHDAAGYEKVDEIPYDFERKRLSVAVRGAEGNLLISKGALSHIIEVCGSIEEDGNEGPIAPHLQAIEELYDGWSAKGIRVLGLAYRKVAEKKAYTKADEDGMTFLGFLLFLDPPKKDAGRLISELGSLGIEVKIITGDNRLIARHVAEMVGFPVKGLITGPELAGMSHEAILHASLRCNIFAEVDPIQKEKIILSLKNAGHVVGFLGDGINDASAIRASDVGISVDTAADVAKDAADIVLLEKGLETLKDGVIEGRKTFANTMKYVFMATSANFGNMFSVAGASLLLPFLPMLPKQILLTNLLTDLPEMTIAADEVDSDLIKRPRRWDIGFIKRFMVFFGVISSVFDYVTFGVLLYAFKAGPVLFRTGWFVESVLSASFAVLCLRTRRPFFSSRPGRLLLLTTLLTAAVTIAIPGLPFSGILAFVPLPASFIAGLILILASYILLIEAGKRAFYRYISRVER